MSTDPTAERFWDREVVAPTHTSWMEHPLVRTYINACIGSSDQPLWPIDWFEQSLQGRRFRRALSIGCGTGALERDLVRRGLVDAVEAFDGSCNSLRIARDTAAREGLGDRIRYFAANFNEPVLPRNRYDGVFIHQAAHHVAKLEKLFRAILHAMTSDGVLYLDEYIGPSRFAWNDKTIYEHRRIFASYSATQRRADTLPLPIQPDDPSEAIRSDEILPQLRIGFTVTALRGYGGNLLSVLYPMIDWKRTPLHALIEREEQMIASGASPYYALVVAHPKRSLARTASSARYYLEPKLKRLLRELRRLW